jgi:hypothetical protein
MNNLVPFWVSFMWPLAGLNSWENQFPLSLQNRAFELEQLSKLVNPSLVHRRCNT